MAILRSLPGAKPILDPIEWKSYEGETVNTHLIIRKGKKIQETAFYEDRVKAIPRGNAYCIGNGPSRKDFDLNRLKATGQTYGCNALYRDFVPDFILGYDFQEYGNGKLNNIYQDTENYGERNNDTVFTGWLKQFRDLLKMRPYVNYTVVHDSPPDFMNYLQTGTDLGNSFLMSYKEFEDTVLSSS